jgi:hypothetical protein
MKVYTFYTESHLRLLNIFLEHFPCSETIDLVVRKMPQECTDAIYMTEGWNLTMRRKVEYVIDAINATPEGEWFVHTDCDVVLFQDWEKILERYRDLEVDMLIQDDFNAFGAGFFFAKNTERTRALWVSVLDHLHEHSHDQRAMNYWMGQIPDLKVELLPYSYFTYGLFGKHGWEGEEFIIPDIADLKMFHGNWTVGVESKIKIIQEALRQKRAVAAPMEPTDPSGKNE